MTSNPAIKGEHQGVPYEVLDLTKLSLPGFVSAFYYTVGEDLEAVEEPGMVTTVLEGPHASAFAAECAAIAFIENANRDWQGTQP